MARWLTLLSIIAAIPPKNQADIIFVDDDADPNGDGLSWNTAYDDLQTALSNAMFGDEIWVAVGIYRPAALSNAMVGDAS